MDPTAPDGGCEFLHSSDAGLCARIDLTIYSEPAVLRVAHRFTDRCYVHLEREQPTLLIARFQGKSSGADLQHAAGEFLNALLDQTLREQIQRETEPVRNLILAHALADTALLRPELETIDPLADPQEIGRPDASPSRR